MVERPSTFGIPWTKLGYNIAAVCLPMCRWKRAGTSVRRKEVYSPDLFTGGILDPFTGKQVRQPDPLPYAGITDPKTLNE